MTFWQAYVRFWTQAFNLKDRARRLEYWAPALIHGILGGVLAVAGFAAAFNGNESSTDITAKADDPLWVIIVSTILLMIFTIPNFTLLYRRFQDLNISGWWALIPEFLYSFSESTTAYLGDTAFTISIYGLYAIVQLIIFIMMFFRGTEGPNKYGPDPYTGVYSDRTY